MNRMLAFAYGLVSYMAFFATFCYAIGFVTNLVVPKSIDSGPAGPVGSAVLINVLLLGAFGISHSIMARPGFKKWWTQFVPAPRLFYFDDLGTEVSEEAACEWCGDEAAKLQYADALEREGVSLEVKFLRHVLPACIVECQGPRAQFPIQWEKFVTGRIDDSRAM